MSALGDVLFVLLLNAFVQISVFAIAAALLSGLVAKAKASQQHNFYLAALLLCLAIPVINTAFRPTAFGTGHIEQRVAAADVGSSTQRFWIWQGRGTPQRQIAVPGAWKTAVLGLWGVLILFRLIRFGRAAVHVRRLRSEATRLSAAQSAAALRIIDARRRVALLESAAIEDPATVGVISPVILLPTGLLPNLNQQELSAIVAHEYGHIRRRDYLVHLVSELLSLPVAWHPGIRYLKSKVSQARERACDDYAAEQMGNRRLYANTLLRLASLCFHARRSDAMALGIFDGDNLETRIMRLTEKNVGLSRASWLGLALLVSMTFGSGALLARGMSVQAEIVPSSQSDRFAGTWHWMFDGKSFVTLVLTRSGSGYTGSVTGSRIALDDDGGLLRADPAEDPSPIPIAHARLEGSALRLVAKDGFAFTLTLKDNTHAEIRPLSAPANMKPIPAEKALSR